MFDNDDDFFSSEGIFGTSNQNSSDTGNSSFGGESYNLDDLMLPGSDSVETNNNGNGLSFGDGKAKGKEVLKYAIIAIIGLVILLIVAIGVRKLGSSKREDTKPKKEVTTVKDKDGYNKDSEVPSSTNNSESNTSGGGWTKFESYSSFEFSNEIESTFTVTGIEYYATVSNSYNDKSVKAVLTGNISGLVGTYMMEVPYDKAENISIGLSFKCYYKIADSGKYKVVAGIRP